MYDDDPEWEETPEAKLYREAAEAERRWAAWCEVRVQGLLKNLPLERIYVPTWRQQVFWKLKRWR